MELLILFAMMGVLFWFMSRGARKAQQSQIEKRNEALVVGNNVVTQAGFLGRIVDIDGDAVTLESPAGDESVWLRTAIVSQMDIPLGEADEYLEELDGVDSLGVPSEFDEANRGEGSLDERSEFGETVTDDRTPNDSEHNEGRITNASPFVDDDGNPADDK